MRHRRVDASNRRQRTLISIRQLTEQVVNGMPPEVVERPTSVVKDLMENASNAGASRIDIFSDGGGLRRIGITDDGSGMTHGDLALKQTLALASVEMPIP